MSIQPQGENIRKAVRWLSAQRQDNPTRPVQRLIDEAGLTFNLTPSEAAYLERLVRDGNAGDAELLEE